METDPLERLIEFLVDQMKAEMESVNARFMCKLQEIRDLNHTLSTEKLDSDKLITIEFLANRIKELLGEL